VASGVAMPAGMLASTQARAENESRIRWQNQIANQPGAIKPSPLSTEEEKTPLDDILEYNNFYEFGSQKWVPSKHADALDIEPWSVAVEGKCNKPGVYALEDLVKDSQLEERIYRLRCNAPQEYLSRSDFGFSARLLVNSGRLFSANLFRLSSFCVVLESSVMVSASYNQS